MTSDQYIRDLDEAAASMERRCHNLAQTLTGCPFGCCFPDLAVKQAGESFYVQCLDCMATGPLRPWPERAVSAWERAPIN